MKLLCVICLLSCLEGNAVAWRECSDTNVKYMWLIIFSQKVQSRERRCAKPVQKASPSKVSRVHVSFQNSFWRRHSSSVTCLTLGSWRLWSFFWQVVKRLENMTDWLKMYFKFLTKFVTCIFLWLRYSSQISWWTFSCSFPIFLIWREIPVWLLVTCLITHNVEECWMHLFFNQVNSSSLSFQAWREV